MKYFLINIHITWQENNTLDKNSKTTAYQLWYIYQTFFPIDFIIFQIGNCTKCAKIHFLTYFIAIVKILIYCATMLNAFYLKKQLSQKIAEKYIGKRLIAFKNRTLFCVCKKSNIFINTLFVLRQRQNHWLLLPHWWKMYS